MALQDLFRDSWCEFWTSRNLLELEGGILLGEHNSNVKFLKGPRLNEWPVGKYTGAEWTLKIRGHRSVRIPIPEMLYPRLTAYATNSVLSNARFHVRTSLLLSPWTRG
ncbi:hypothetical protein WDW86_10980, partial [Bdellovibrionota bacterium FG-2]